MWSYSLDRGTEAARSLILSFCAPGGLWVMESASRSRVGFRPEDMGVGRRCPHRRIDSYAEERPRANSLHNVGAGFSRPVRLDVARALKPARRRERRRCSITVAGLRAGATSSNQNQFFLWR